MEKLSALINFVRGLATPKRLIFVAIVAAISYLLVGCTSSKHLQLHITTADDVNVQYVDSLSVKLPL